MSKHSDDTSFPSEISSPKAENISSLSDTSDGKNKTERASSLDIQFQKRFSVNLISNVIYFILSIIVGLCLTPFFLDTLGEAAYALVPLATSITSYITLVIDAVNAGITRFLMTDLQRGDTVRSNETFNSSFFGIVFLVLIFIPVAVIVAYFSPSIFNIANESSISVFLLFLMVFGSALIRAGASNFLVTLFAYNRLDLRNYVNATNLLLQVILIVVFFFVFSPSLPLIGIAYLIATVVSVIVSVIFTRKISPQIEVRWRYFRAEKAIEIGRVSFWIVVSNVSNVLRNSVGLIAANILIGAVAETQFSLVIMWTTLLWSVAGLVTTTLTPMMYSYRAKDDKIGLAHASVFAMKTCGLFFGLIIALVCVFAPELFTLWVGEEYAFLTPLVWITVLPMFIRIQTNAIDPIYQSYLHVRVPGIVNLLFGIITVVLVFALTPAFDDGLYGIAWLTTLTAALSPFFYLLYNSYVLKVHPLTFIKPLIYGAIPTVILFAAGMAIRQIPLNSFVLMVAGSIVLAGLYLLFISRFILKKDEKKIIRSCLPNIVERHLPKWML